MPLSDVEVRVLGALMEKEATTPEAYPLSSQALATACSQKTSRDPVMELHLQEVQDAVRRASDRGLLDTVHEPGARVPKHRHRMRAALDLNPLEAALLSVLMLRGPQTPGELRGRVERYGPHPEAAEVVATLHALADRPAPLVRSRGRSPGQSQDRWTHTLGADEERLRPRARPPESGARGGPAARGGDDAEDAASGAAAGAHAPGAPAPGASAPGADAREAGASAAPERDAPSVEARLATLERRVAALEAALRDER